MQPASRDADPIEFACGGSLVGMVLFNLCDTCMAIADATVGGSDPASVVGMAVLAAASLWNRRVRSAPSA